MVGSGPENRRLTFGGDLDHCLDTGRLLFLDSTLSADGGKWYEATACTALHGMH